MSSIETETLKSGLQTKTNLEYYNTMNQRPLVVKNTLGLWR